jgi:hypothetical protein
MDEWERERTMHAEMLAALWNGPFATDGVIWTADDLLGKTDRAERIAQQKRDKAFSDKLIARSKNAPVDPFFSEITKNRADARKVN